MELKMPQDMPVSGLAILLQDSLICLSQEKRDRRLFFSCSHLSPDSLLLTNNRTKFDAFGQHLSCLTRTRQESQWLQYNRIVVWVWVHWRRNDATKHLDSEAGSRWWLWWDEHDEQVAHDMRDKKEEESVGSLVLSALLSACFSFFLLLLWMNEHVV